MQTRTEYMLVYGLIGNQWMFAYHSK